MDVIIICFNIIDKVVELSKVYDQPLGRKCVFKQIKDLIDELEGLIFPVENRNEPNETITLNIDKIRSGL
jgi:hypothetical protein